MNSVIVMVTSSQFFLLAVTRTVMDPAVEPIDTSPVASTEHPSALPVMEYALVPVVGMELAVTCTLVRFHVPVLGLGGEAITVLGDAVAPVTAGGPE